MKYLVGLCGSQGPSIVAHATTDASSDCAAMLPWCGLLSLVLLPESLVFYSSSPSFSLIAFPHLAFSSGVIDTSAADDRQGLCQFFLYVFQISATERTIGLQAGLSNFEKSYSFSFKKIKTARNMSTPPIYCGKIWAWNTVCLEKWSDFTSSGWISIGGKQTIKDQDELVTKHSENLNSWSLQVFHCLGSLTVAMVMWPVCSQTPPWNHLEVQYIRDVTIGS